MLRKLYLKDKKGRKISALFYKPRKDNKQGIICLHGFKGSKEELFWLPLHKELLKSGFSVLAFDYYGHGTSDGEFKKFTMTKAVDGFKTAINFFLKKGYKNLGIIGHSIGGGIAFLNAQYLEIKGIVVISPVYDSKFFLYLLKTKRQKNFLKRHGWIDYTTSNGRRFKIGKDFFNDLKNHDIPRAARQITKSILFIQGGRDEKVLPNKTKKLFNQIILSEVKDYVLIKDASHVFHRQSDLKQIIRHSVSWFKKYLHKKPPVVNVIVKHNDEILILKRGRRVGSHQGYWYVVGGYIKGRVTREGEIRIIENPMIRARTEVEEEVGIPSSKLKFIKRAPPFYWRDQESDKNWLVYPFLFESKTRKVRLNWEHDDYRWVKIKDLKKYRHISILKKIIKKLLK